MHKKAIVWFDEVGKHDVPLVGGKGANLGEMTRAGFPVPNGFIVTSSAYFDYLTSNNLEKKIKDLLTTVNYENTDSIMQVSQHIKHLVMHGKMDNELAKSILTHYERLSGHVKDALVAVRSSATAEDLPSASFAGQQETYLNVKGEAILIERIRQGWASLFEPRAMFYRHEQKFDHFKVGIALVVQKMVESQKSGVMFTLDPVTNDRSRIIIEAIYGLGELIVQGAVTPDHYEVEKKTMDITQKHMAAQITMMVKAGKTNKIVEIPKSEASKQKISDNIILELAVLGKKLEDHYYFPQDIEWAVEKNKVYIVQTRAITTVHDQPKKKEVSQISNLPLLLTGSPASPGIASGPVKILKSASEIGNIVHGDVLVAPQTNPDFVPAMKKAAAIVTDAGGRTSHAAIVSRELGIPAVVGTGSATKDLKTGMVVTVDGSKGNVYKGGAKTSANSNIQTVEVERVKTATKVYVNLAEPELAEKVATTYDTDGVGLLRAEFMMAGIGVHPKRMIHDGKKKEYIDKLANGLEQFCRAFYPRPVVYRASDFKTNEYRSLKGGKEYEPEEANPMLGYRGAFRYIHDPEVFRLELEAIKLVRNKKNLKNLWVMVPFVRTVKELLEIKKIVTASGLSRSANFKLWMMVEIPSNVLLLEKFLAAGIDGVSIGSNDLTMLLLGTDRDNSEVSTEFDEQNEAVLWVLEKIVKTCHKHGVTSSLCGQAASTYPNLVENLVKWGITSVSVSPDAIEQTRQVVYEAEKKFLR